MCWTQAWSKCIVAVADADYGEFQRQPGDVALDHSAERAALRGVLGSVLRMFEDGVTHLGVATDHVIESFRNELEKANLLYWQLTCRSFFSPEEWEWFLAECGYRGDVGYIFFE